MAEKKYRKPNTKKVSDSVSKLNVAVKHKSEIDKQIFDLVLKCLFNTADKDSLLFEHDILEKHNVMVSEKEKARLWNVLKNSGWISPVIGFGNSGKLALTKPGFQLMEKYGGYLEYLEATTSSEKTEAIILPFNPQPEVPEVKHITPPPRVKK